MSRRTLAGVLLAAALAACAGGSRWQSEGRHSVEVARAREAQEPRARNLVLFLGDGMGITTITAARILEGQLRGEPGEENWLAFERLPHVALVKTYNVDQQTPDSAGTMTAIVSGEKTRAGVLGVDAGLERGDAAGVAAHRLGTLFEEAEERGLATGFVTTTRITHATPAALYAHSPDRTWESDGRLPPAARAIDFPDLARQLVEFPYGDGVDVVLGGGRAQLQPQEMADPEYPQRRGARLDGRDLVAEWLGGRPRSQYVWNRAGFEAVRPEKTDRLAGLFEPSHMQFEADRDQDAAGEPSLAEMTRKALDILSRRREGFVLMVEGGRIDHAHHLGNAYRALTETIEFSRAVAAALEHPSGGETLVMVTADHGHVLTIAGYPTRGNPILGLVVENEGYGGGEGGGPATARDGTGRPYTTLGYANGPGYTGATLTQPEGPKRADVPPEGMRGITRGRPQLGAEEVLHRDYAQEAAVPMRAETHSGEDVPVYAGGPGAALVGGVLEQSSLYHIIVEALGWRSQDQPGLRTR